MLSKVEVLLSLACMLCFSNPLCVANVITDCECSNVKTKGIWEDFEPHNLLAHIMGKTKTELSFGDSLDR